METLSFNLQATGNKFKILNATNGGPVHKRGPSLYISNFADYKAARIPYSRNHDSAMCSIYGGPYSHDVSSIFPNFDADPYDPESYDFACTDESIQICLEAGTETFFRLGQSIEHQIKKHHILPPKDYKKWAVICEQIIRHYNEGWANGFRLNIQYWEIWNEPDLDSDTSPTWGGTPEQFYDFYETAAKHLKSTFPHLKIGGPALCCSPVWADSFLCEMQKRNVPIDFFSFHIYCSDPPRMLRRSDRLKDILIKYNYGSVEKILNEWNYVKDWQEHLVYSKQSMVGIKGAAFTLSCMCAAQQSDAIDMLMYYDTRPSTWNGVFDFLSQKPLKGYYPLYWYGMFYDLQKEIPAENSIEDVYSLCGVDENGKALAVVTYFIDDDTAGDKTVKLDFGRPGNYEIYLLDDEHTNELVATTDDLTFTLKNYTCILIKEI